MLESLTLNPGLQMGDALIAATALEHRLPVLPGNTKHFEAVEAISVKAFRM